MVYIYAAREAFRRHEIDNIGFVRTAYNSADDLTKLKGNGSLFHLIVFVGNDHPVENFVVR